MEPSERQLDNCRVCVFQKSRSKLLGKTRLYLIKSTRSVLATKKLSKERFTVSEKHEKGTFLLITGRDKGRFLLFEICETLLSPIKKRVIKREKGCCRLARAYEVA